MIYSEDYKIQVKDIVKDNYINDRGILEIFENIATHNSDVVGFGVNDIEATGLAWILMDWKVEVINRPKYGQNLKVNTWARELTASSRRTYTYRDFEMYDENGQLMAIGTSKWVLTNTKTGRITLITDELLDKYKPEGKHVFDDEEIDRIKICKSYSSVSEYEVTRRDVDFINHMHNIYYLDYAYNALPDEAYENAPFDNIRISYKRESKLGEKLVCKYLYENNEHKVDIYNADETKLHCSVRVS